MEFGRKPKVEVKTKRRAKGERNDLFAWTLCEPCFSIFLAISVFHQKFSSKSLSFSQLDERFCSLIKKRSPILSQMANVLQIAVILV